MSDTAQDGKSAGYALAIVLNMLSTTPASATAVAMARVGMIRALKLVIVAAVSASAAANDALESEFICGGAIAVELGPFTDSAIHRKALKLTRANRLSLSGVLVDRGGW